MKKSGGVKTPGLEAIKYDEKGLVPAIAQDADTSEVLMLAYMNREALEKTLSTGRAHFYSRSRGSLWLKGETSGNFLDVKGVLYDCDADTVLLLVEPKGPACHTGERSCFYRRLDKAAPKQAPRGPVILNELYSIIRKRKDADPAKSYVASLYAKGAAKINEKIAEESAELIDAGLNKDEKELVHELADLWFHSLVLLSYRGVEIERLYTELGRRFGLSGIEEKQSRPKK